MNNRNDIIDVETAQSRAVARADSLKTWGWVSYILHLIVAVGAVLTQNTNWGNVEKAVGNLRAVDALTPEGMARLTADELAECIRPSGYYRVKAGRLLNLLAFLREECSHDLAALAARDLEELRPLLLAVKGIGPETADSILLYALNKPTFVVDAYTKRILNRHALIVDCVDRLQRSFTQDAGYEEIREFFMDALDPAPGLFNEYHALLVRVAKQFCIKKAPHCDGCPLQPFLDA